MFKRCIYKYVVVTSILLLCNCLPENQLQHFSSHMLANSGRIQIESGEKHRYGEIGVSYANSFKQDSAKFVVDKASEANCSFRFPNQIFDIYGAVLGEKLVSAQMQLQIGKIYGESYYDFLLGIGTRLYKGPVAGRLFCSLGLTNTFIDVNILRREQQMDYDLLDYYKANRPYIGVTFGGNTRIPSFLVNPFLNLNFRYYTLFRFEDIAISLVALSGTTGIYKKFGPLTSAVGLRLNYYYHDNTQILHPEFVAQTSFDVF